MIDDSVGLTPFAKMTGALSMLLEGMRRSSHPDDVAGKLKTPDMRSGKVAFDIKTNVMLVIVWLVDILSLDSTGCVCDFYELRRACAKLCKRVIR